MTAMPVIPNERILITGATGFAGRHLVNHLTGEGRNLRALVRRPSTSLPGEVEQVVLPPNSSYDPTALVPACHGIASVVHLAARVHQMSTSARRDEAGFVRDNVDFTSALFTAASLAGARRFIFASSVKAVGESSDHPLTESVPLFPLDAYGRSKAAAERALSSHADGVEVIILRFPLIYGPLMKGNLISLLQLIRRGLPLPLGGLTNRRSIVSVENAVAVLASAGSGGVPAGLYNVCDPVSISTTRLVEVLAEGMNLRARLFSVPHRVWRMAGPVGTRLAGSLELDCSRLRSTCAWYPVRDRDDELRRSAAWFASTG